jgi:hypothetical protein
MTIQTHTEDLDPVQPATANEPLDVAAPTASIEPAAPASDDEPDLETETGRPPALGKRFFNLRTAISFAVGFSIIGFLFTRVQIDVGAILDWVRQANPWLLAAATLCFYSTFPVRALRWRKLLANVAQTETVRGGSTAAHRSCRSGPVRDHYLLVRQLHRPAASWATPTAFLLKNAARHSRRPSGRSWRADHRRRRPVHAHVAGHGVSVRTRLPPEVLILLQIGCGLVILVASAW